MRPTAASRDTRRPTIVHAVWVCLLAMLGTPHAAQGSTIPTRNLPKPVVQEITVPPQPPGP